MTSRYFSYIQGMPGDIENSRVGTHEHNVVSIVGKGDDHLDSGCNTGIVRQFDFVQSSSQFIGIGGDSQQVDAGLPLLADRICCEVCHDYGNSDLLVAASDNGDREVDGVVGVDSPSVNFHFNVPREFVPADWSQFSDRELIVHLEQEAA